MRHGDDKRDTISMTGSRPSENSLKRRAVSASINAALENRDTQHGSPMSRGSITQTRNIYVQPFPPTGSSASNPQNCSGDGTVFDSSIKRGQPAEFPLNGVVPCWTEALQKMKKGEKAQVVCPSSLAYGDRGSPPDIPPGATLSFEVELLDFHKP